MAVVVDVDGFLCCVFVAQQSAVCYDHIFTLCCVLMNYSEKKIHTA